MAWPFPAEEGSGVNQPRSAEVSSMISLVLPEYREPVRALLEHNIQEEHLKIIISFFALDGSIPVKGEVLAEIHSLSLEEVDQIVHDWYPFLVVVWRNLKKK